MSEARYTTFNSYCVFIIILICVLSHNVLKCDAIIYAKEIIESSRLLIFIINKFFARTPTKKNLIWDFLKHIETNSKNFMTHTFYDERNIPGFFYANELF